MEFVIATFPTVRWVRADGSRQAQTGQIFGVELGTHVFDLGSPHDYDPPRVKTAVINTSQTAPLVIGFNPLVIDESVEATVPRARRAPRKKAAAPKKKKTTTTTKVTKRTTSARRAGGRKAARTRGRRKTR